MSTRNQPRGDARLRAASTLQERPPASRIQSEFVALLTQELRTNLQAMLGFTQLMERDREVLPDRQRERLRRVLAAGDQLLRVLDDACVLSRIQSGQRPLSIQPVDVARAFERVRRELASAAASRDLVLGIAGSPLPHVHVAADPGALVDILRELTANAIAYNKPNGSVTLGVTPLGAARLRISVIDTGLGIPVEEQHKLFRPFPHVVRAEGTAGGVGLGLVTCRCLATLMWGSVGYRSVPGQGSEFWLDLPVHPGDPGA